MSDSIQTGYPLTPSQIAVAASHAASMFKLDGITQKPLTPIFIWGAMGIGKTEIVRQTAKRMNCDILPLHLPQFDPTDIKGIPIRTDEGGVRWVASSVLPQMYRSPILTKDNLDQVGSRIKNSVQFNLKSQNDRDVMAFVLDRNDKLVAWVNYMNHPDNDAGMGLSMNGRVLIGNDAEKLIGYRVILSEKCFIFLDELSAADPSTQNAALQLCQDRRINEYDIPYGVPIFGAGNRESDGAYVQAMSAPLANRFCHYTMVVSVKDWLQWAMMEGVRADIIGYVQAKGSPALFSPNLEGIEQGQAGFATPRSWVNLNWQFDDDLPVENQVAMVAGCVGHGHAGEFMNHREMCGKLPDPHAVLDGMTVDKSMIDNLERSALFMCVTGIAYALGERYRECFGPDGKCNPEKAEYWESSVENCFRFIIDHIENRDLIAHVFYFLTNGLNIRMKHFRSKSLLELADNFSDFFSKLA